MRVAPPNTGTPLVSPAAEVVAHSWRPPACAGNFLIMEVAAEQAELPELVRDVLPDIGDDAVRAHDHLLARFLVLFIAVAGARRPHGLPRCA